MFSDVLIIARNRRTNKKLTLVKQLYFLDKVLLKLSEVSSNGVLLIYKNEVGLLSEVVKLEIWDYNGEVNTREIWCNKVEIAKVSARKSNNRRKIKRYFLWKDTFTSATQLLRFILEKKSRMNKYKENSARFLISYILFCYPKSFESYYPGNELFFLGILKITFFSYFHREYIYQRSMEQEAR